MDPIATYKEARLKEKRVFLLYDDRIYVRGSKRFEPESGFEAEILLTSVEPGYSRVKVRGKAFFACIGIAVVSFIACAILIVFAKDLSIIVAAFGLLTLIVSATLFQNVEILRFPARSGGVAFELVRSGRDTSRLDRFVDAVIRQIHWMQAS